MSSSPPSDKPVIVLIGNYPLDRQESMLRFRDLLQIELELRSFITESITPDGCFGHIFKSSALAKWLGYIDKYVLFPPVLALRLSKIRRKFPDRKIVVHICDHANAVYAGIARRWFPVLVTCHDLLAVRGALGEDTYCPASGFGKYLQAAILRGIGKATYVACVSKATRADLLRLSEASMAERSQVVPLALNFPYRVLPQEEAVQKLAAAGISLPYRGFILHVGSSHPRKNRKALLLAISQIKDTWSGKIVFAGEPVTNGEKAMADSLGLADRFVGIPRPNNDTLLALYNAALAIVFVSYSEGFGWPILEAQASGCPVICSNRTSIPEVAGDGALIQEPDDHAAIAKDILRLEDAGFRENVVHAGAANAAGYTRDRMMSAYEKLYQQI